MNTDLIGKDMNDKFASVVMPYEVFDGNGVSHGKFVSMEEARGCVEFDKSFDWAIYQNGERAEGGLREVHHTMYKPSLSHSDMLLAAEQLLKSAEAMEKEAHYVGVLLASPKADLLHSAIRCRLLSRKLTAMLRR